MSAYIKCLYSIFFWIQSVARKIERNRVAVLDTCIYESGTVFKSKCHIPMQYSNTVFINKPYNISKQA